MNGPHERIQGCGLMSAQARVILHPSSNPEPFARPEAVADYCYLSVGTIKSWASQSKIPCYERNRTVRFRMFEVEERWTEGRRRERGVRRC